MSLNKFNNDMYYVTPLFVFPDQTDPVSRCNFKQFNLVNNEPQQEGHTFSSDYGNGLINFLRQLEEESSNRQMAWLNR